MMSSKKTGIVDIIVFYAPYGEELLDFRINLLKDHVDWFIVTECDRTQLGDYCGLKFEEVAEKLQLPMEKILYVKKEIQDLNGVHITNDDIKIAQLSNTVDTKIEIKHALSKALERIQKDAFLSIINEFDYDTVFIFGDSDEIIKPENIQWLSKLCREYPNNLLKIPLIHLQGRADLRVFSTTSNSYKGWDTLLFMAQRHHFDAYPPSTLRRDTGYEDKFTYVHPVHDDKVIKDLGWHFSWMGTSKHKRIKYDSYTHKIDNTGFLLDKETHDKILKIGRFGNNSLTPDAQKTDILKKIDLKELPDLLFSKREYIDFFFGLE